MKRILFSTFSVLALALVTVINLSSTSDASKALNAEVKAPTDGSPVTVMVDGSPDWWNHYYGMAQNTSRTVTYSIKNEWDPGDIQVSFTRLYDSNDFTFEVSGANTNCTETNKVINCKLQNMSVGEIRVIQILVSSRTNTDIESVLLAHAWRYTQIMSDDEKPSYSTGVGGNTVGFTQII